MDFVKKNLALLICAVCSFILACILLYFIFSTSAKVKKSSAAVETEMNFFNEAERDGLKLRSAPGEELENLLQARRNFEAAEKFYALSREELARRYSLDIKLPGNSPEAVRRINEKIRQMTDYVLKKGIVFNGLAQQFQTIVERGNINSAEFEAIFRQLYLYEYLVNKIAEAGIKTVVSLEWLQGFAMEEADLYNITPVWLSARCELEQALNFLNQLSSDERILFYIKSCSFTAPDRYSEAALDYAALQREGQRQNLPGGGEDFGMDGFDGAPRQRAPRAAARRSPVRDASEREGGAARGQQPERFVKPEPKRQDNLVFEDKYVALELRLDLYEFKKLEQE
ncbi:MAG: Amuc_1100 family pilus-like protein [Lentisphaeria bacterium]|jgi:hypothetical protein|nr:Amuc_1100 family pilus-like protein [Lentisphaeria bacterium]MDY0175673.1 Amuc_1100 family pilus-like protein [Lentisphaeria bacterium]NLZ60717.1 hypothetical protein [Lentisphaerota bacterium]